AARCGRKDRDDAIGTNGATRPRARIEPPGLMQWRLRHEPRDAGALTHPSPFPPTSSLGTPRAPRLIFVNLWRRRAGTRHCPCRPASVKAAVGQNSTTFGIDGG